MVNVKPVKLGKNVRMSFSRINEVLEMPNLIEVQKNSYKWFLEKGLKEVFDDMSAITDYTGNLVLDFVDYHLDDEPKYSVCLLYTSLFVILIQHLDVKAKRLQLFNQNLEGFRNTRSRHILTLNNGFIGLDTTDHVVRLHSQDFLQGIGSTVSLQCPNLHFAEALAAKLGFTAERLLGDKGVRAGGTGMDFIINQMMEF